MLHGNSGMPEKSLTHLEFHTFNQLPEGEHLNPKQGRRGEACWAFKFHNF